MQLSRNIDKLGTAGLFLTALFSPCCFPLFAFAASALGLGSFELFGGWTMWTFQGMVLVSCLGLVVSYRKHGCAYPILLAFPSAALVMYGYHLDESDNWLYWLYAGMFGLLAATAVNYHRNKMHYDSSRKIELKTLITCPVCSHHKEEEMPTDSCQFFYECENCHTVLRPKPGDCCVFCSYGTVQCPPMQAGDKSCCR